MSKRLLWLAELVDAELKEQRGQMTEDRGQKSEGRAEDSDGKVEIGKQKAEIERLFVWKHNALRHSFISYRVAQIQNVAQTALEAGNSPRMVFSNYREIVRPADAEKWFGITPEAVEAAKAARQTGAAGKIIRLPVEAAA